MALTRVEFEGGEDGRSKMSKKLNVSAMGMRIPRRLDATYFSRYERRENTIEVLDSIGGEY